MTATSRRRILGSAAAAGVIGHAGLPARAGTRRTGAPALPTRATPSISESFAFPEWTDALRATVTSGTAADLAFWAAYQSQPRRRPVGAGLLTLPAPGVELFAPDLARHLAAAANDRLAAVTRASRGRIAGLATIAAADPRAAEEAARAITTLGLAGLSLGANRGWRLDHPQLQPVFALAAAHDVPIYLPAAYAPLAGDAPYRARGRAGIIAGAAADSADHARQLIFGGVLDAHPGLRVVLARLGEATPYWHGHLRDTYDALAQSGRPLPRRPIQAYFTDQIQITTADITSTATAAYCRAVLGTGRVLTAASGRPWTV